VVDVVEVTFEVPVWDWTRRVPKALTVLPIPTVAVAGSVSVVVAVALPSDTNPPPWAVALEVSLESWLVARIVTFPVGLATLDATPVAVTTSFDPSVAWLELVIVVVLVGEPSAIAPPVLLLVVAWTPDVVLFAETVTFPPAA